MKAKNRFDETKIKLVMKVRGLSREAAMRELHMDKVARRKAEEPSVRIDVGNRHLTGKEFVGFTGDDDDFMIAEDFFED